MRLIDADELLEDFKDRARAARNWKENALNNGDEEITIRADATLAFLTEVKLTIEKAPTVERPQGERTEDDTPAGTWIPEEETFTDLSGTIETYTRFNCDRCLQGQNFGPYPFCPWCGSKMNPEIREETKDGT